MDIRTFVLLLVSAGLVHTVVTACDYGWFGPNCEYKCHCGSTGLCDVNGSCEENCESGWFGPACQYQDLADANILTTTPTKPALYLTDQDDNSCVDNITQIAVHLDDENITTIFSWLRIKFLTTDMSTRTMSLAFQSPDQSNLVECPDLQNFMIDHRTRDLHCYRTGISSYVYILFNSSTTVCTLHISGGRNVALKQQALLSSVFNNHTKYGASNAVDGVLINNCKKYGCAFTETNATKPTLIIKLSIPALIYRSRFYSGLYTLGNNNYFQEGINYKKLNSDGIVSIEFDSEIQFVDLLFTYAREFKEPTASISISNSNSHLANGSFIIFREVELYGESDCFDGTYGLGCLKTCNCKIRGETCFVSTGSCPSGCPLGYQGEGCKQICDPGYFGTNCLQKCGDTCRDVLCHHLTGHCIRCHPGHYGDTCELRCSDHCAGDRMCDVNGTCLYGCTDGYHDDKCLFGEVKHLSSSHVSQTLPVMGYESVYNTS
ncbi:uncharacterized protein LOC131950620 [Physella acuta]|uniref:uncharacterized protein LOC131950620 n=1 Tax=Physella acuta TaxID=109671 RepID=UPI0027DB83A6|nr:uncharacterized protein LOC131950620 [Physella acuta]